MLEYRTTPNDENHFTDINKMLQVICPYCFNKTEYVDSSVIYWRSYGMIYLCKDCRAYVWVHKWTEKPKGIPANEELRELRKQAHALFDPIWQSWKKTRKNAYNWLSQKLWIPFKETHIGMFDNDKCKKTINICSNTK